MIIVPRSYFTISASNLLHCLETLTFKDLFLLSFCFSLSLVPLVLILAKMNALSHEEQALGHPASLTLYSVHLKPSAPLG